MDLAMARLGAVPTPRFLDVDGSQGRGKLMSYDDITRIGRGLAREPLEIIRSGIRKPAHPPDWGHDLNYRPEAMS